MPSRPYRVTRNRRHVDPINLNPPPDGVMISATVITPPDVAVVFSADITSIDSPIINIGGVDTVGAVQTDRRLIIFEAGALPAMGDLVTWPTQTGIRFGPNVTPGLSNIWCYVQP